MCMSPQTLGDGHITGQVSGTVAPGAQKKKKKK